MSCLIITHEGKKIDHSIIGALEKDSIPVLHVNDYASALSLAQQQLFDVIVLDNPAEGIETGSLIRLFRVYNPQVKVIVTTPTSSRSFETQIRKENIYYFHLESFGPDDLILAITSAYRRNAGDRVH